MTIRSVLLLLASAAALDAQTLIQMSDTQFGMFAKDAGFVHGGLYRSRALPKDAGVRFFFPNPLTGAAKRLNMYLRWMARPDDGVDLGLWRFVRTRDLVMPLDTHIFRIGRHLGWTARKTPGFRTALDITRSLARFDPEDPVKYDFALSRLGILEGCPRHLRARDCELCELCT